MLGLSSPDCDNVVKDFMFGLSSLDCDDVVKDFMLVLSSLDCNDVMDAGGCLAEHHLAL